MENGMCGYKRESYRILLYRNICLIICSGISTYVLRYKTFLTFEFIVIHSNKYLHSGNKLISHKTIYYSNPIQTQTFTYMNDVDDVIIIIFIC